MVLPAVTAPDSAYGTQGGSGLLVAPPGSGKTVMVAALLARVGRPTLVLVHSQQLVRPWREQLRDLCGLDRHQIGTLAGGRNVQTRVVDVATLQTLAARENLADTVRGYGLVIVDESHHVSALSFERVIDALRARRIIGLTATPRRRDGLHPIAEMQIGPVLHTFAEVHEPEATAVARHLRVRTTSFQPAALPTQATMAEVYAALVADSGRNEQIARDIETVLSAGRWPLVLTERVEHVRWLANRLTSTGRQVIALHGGLSARERRLAIEYWFSLPRTTVAVLVATGRFVGEGFDDPRLDTLFVALPVAWRGTVVQYAGRLQRKLAGKTAVTVYDYLDAEVPMLRRMLAKRRAGYLAAGYVEVREPVAHAGRLL